MTPGEPLHHLLDTSTQIRTVGAVNERPLKLSYLDDVPVEPSVLFPEELFCDQLHEPDPCWAKSEVPMMRDYRDEGGAERMLDHPVQYQLMPTACPPCQSTGPVIR